MNWTLLSACLALLLTFVSASEFASTPRTYQINPEIRKAAIIGAQVLISRWKCKAEDAPKILSFWTMPHPEHIEDAAFCIITSQKLSRGETEALWDSTSKRIKGRAYALSKSLDSIVSDKYNPNDLLIFISEYDEDNYFRKKAFKAVTNVIEKLRDCQNAVNNGIEAFSSEFAGYAVRECLPEFGLKAEYLDVLSCFKTWKSKLFRRAVRDSILGSHLFMRHDLESDQSYRDKIKRKLQAMIDVVEDIKVKIDLRTNDNSIIKKCIYIGSFYGISIASSEMKKGEERQLFDKVNCRFACSRHDKPLPGVHGLPVRSELLDSGPDLPCPEEG